MFLIYTNPSRKGNKYDKLEEKQPIKLRSV